MNGFRTYVFGHTGFVGSALCARLEARDMELAAASSAQCDLTDFASVQSFLADMPPGSRVVFCSTVNKGVNDSLDSLKANLAMAENLSRTLRTKQDNPAGGLVFLSSVDVYGLRPALPLTEKSLPAPDNHYGLSKLCSEHLLRLNGMRLDGLCMDGGPGCPLAVLRLPGVYGPGDKGRSVMGLLARRILAGQTIRLDGGGTALRDYLFLDDLLDLLEQLLQNPWDGLLNVATGQARSIADLVQVLADALEMEAVTADGPENPRAAKDLTYDTARLERHFPGTVTTTPEQGAAVLAKTLKNPTGENI